MALKIEDLDCKPQIIAGALPAWQAEVDAAQWRSICKSVREQHGRLIALWGSDRREADGQFAIHAALVIESGLLWLTLPVDDTYPGIAEHFPARTGCSVRSRTCSESLPTTSRRRSAGCAMAHGRRIGIPCGRISALTTRPPWSPMTSASSGSRATACTRSRSDRCMRGRSSRATFASRSSANGCFVRGAPRLQHKAIEKRASRR
jgi:hypothetical protein